MRILFITSTRIGDAVLSTGALAHLVDNYPGARITVACGPVVAPLFEAMTDVHEVIALNKKKFAGHWVDLWRRTVGRFWDVVVDLRGSAISWVLLARRRHVAGRSKGTSHKVVTLSKALGLEQPSDPRIVLSPSYSEDAARLLEDGPYLAVCPTANWVGKRWPADRFLELIRRLTNDNGPFSGSKIVVFGGPGEEDMAAPLMEGLDSESVIDLVGKVDLPTAFACLKKTDFFIGNDSGLMHLAAAAGIPTLGVFGPSPDALYAPWGKNCMVVRSESYEAIVNNPEFDHRKPVSYMDNLSVDAVEQAVHSLIQSLPEEKDRK